MAEALIAGRYRPIERHAIGGMSAIWRARDEWTGEMVAVKRLHPFLVSDQVARERLLREADALRALDHPSIVRPREIIDDPADPALVMEFAEGRSLQARLKESGPLAPEEAVGIMTAVADGLAVAHAAGIVHRDIKPANILVDDSGAVQLVDFGIAAIPEGIDALTAPQTMVGTLRYAAPERLEGREATSRTDVWALGAVLYELVSGRPAIPDPEPGRGGPMARPSPPDMRALPPSLRAVVGRAMATDPADRYEDAGAFRDAMAELGQTIDPTAETVVVPTPGMSTPTRGAPIAAVQAAAQRLAAAGQSRWSPVDRAAAGFIAIVALAVILAVAAIGFDGFGAVGAPASSNVPVSPAASVPVATDAPVTAAPEEEDEEPGDNGKGKGKGNGRGSGGRD